MLKSEKSNSLESNFSRKFFFIVGRGRSGTWLLQSILDHHPSICVAPEGEFILSLYKKYSQVKVWTEKENKSFIQHLWKINRVSKWLKPDKQSLKEELSKLSSTADLGERYALVYREYARKMGKNKVRLWGDKMPTYSLFLREISEVFPQAKFIHMVRDPRDTVMSYKKVKFDVNSTAALSRRWVLYNKYIIECKQKYSLPVMTVKYENFVEDLENVLKRICKFLEIYYDPCMLEYYKSPRNVVDWNKDIAFPIKNHKAYKWNEKMDQRNSMLVDYSCRDEAPRFGYEVNHSKVPFYLRLKTLVGKIIGGVSIKLERVCFYLPFNMQVRIVNKMDPLN